MMVRALSVIVVGVVVWGAPALAQIRIDAGLGATTSATGGTLRLNADGSVEAASDLPMEGLPRNASGTEIRTALEVATQDDLDAFEDNLLITNAQVADADSSSKLVAISYWHEGRFLGVVPVKVQSRTEARIGEEDTVTITTEMPWWSFLVFGLGNVQGDVQVALQSDGSFSGNVLQHDNAQARALALEAITSAHAQVGR